MKLKQMYDFFLFYLSISLQIQINDVLTRDKLLKPTSNTMQDNIHEIVKTKRIS